YVSRAAPASARRTSARSTLSRATSPKATSRPRPPSAIMASSSGLTASSIWRRARIGGSRAPQRSDQAVWAAYSNLSHRLGDRPGRAAVHPLLHFAVRRDGSVEPALRQSGEQSERHVYVAPLQSPIR